MVRTGLVVSLLLVLSAGSVGEPRQQVLLRFEPAVGVALSYEISLTEDVVVEGTSVSKIESYDVTLVSTGMTDEGLTTLSLEFTGADAGMTVGDDIGDWRPPVDLDGAVLVVDVTPGMIVGDVRTERRVPGMYDETDLRKYMDALFIRLPDSIRAVGDRWRVELREDAPADGSGEDAPPPILAGGVDYELKKMEEKEGVPCAQLRLRTKVEIHRPTEDGIFVAEGSGDAKAWIALEGGYLVSLESEFAIEGVETIELYSGHTEERDRAVTYWVESSLKR